MPAAQQLASRIRESTTGKTQLFYRTTNERCDTASKENACPRSTCARRLPRRPSSTSPGSPTSGLAARSFFGNSADEYLKVHNRGPLAGPTSPKARAASGNAFTMDWVRSQPRRPHDDRLQHVGRQVPGHTYTFTRRPRWLGPISTWLSYATAKNLKGTVFSAWCSGPLVRGVLEKGV